MGNDRRWSDARRVEAWAGEARVNVIRLAALLAFYANHLVNVYVWDDASAGGSFHSSVTALVLGWSLAVLGVYVCLSRRWLVPGLAYVTVAWDVVFTTLLLLIVRDPRSMLVTLYFLAIASAVLRLSLSLVYVASLGSIAAYLFFLGYIRFYLELPAEQRQARPQQVAVVLALGAAGILAGQAVRQVRRLVRGHPVVVDEARGE